MLNQLKPFELMTPNDYKNLGLRAGLEIHQQVDTEKKLFCRCPAGFYSKEYDAEILRHMRPTLSELGEYDGTALMEFKTKKEIIYQINHETVCTYEMDDTPPFEINQQALDISLEIAMLLNYKLVDEIHIARKQYLDGSIPTGFQRTTIVGIDGWIPYSNRKIGLIQLGLEEDACREVSDFGHERIYRTDRLGMPLIEIVTKPEMRTPFEVAEVANLLRWSVRSTGKVRTGIGAARQDVNVSISGGTRIEIKGVSRIPLIPLLIYNEAFRQFALLQIRDMLAHRDITPETIRASSEEVTPYLSRTSWDPIRNAIERGEEVHCVKLNGFSGILSTPTQTGKVFSKEISDRVRVIACLTRLPNILTSESTEETIDSFAWKKIRRAVHASSHDALVLVWGNAKDVKTGIKEIIIRAKEATVGVPSETRQAFIDGTNGFERILPGPDRMYPDTDLPPLEITKSRKNALRKNIPESPWKRFAFYKKIGIPEHLHRIITTSAKASFFEQIIKTYQCKPVHVARLMFESTKSWKRLGLPVERISEKDWEGIFERLTKQPALLHASEIALKSYLSNEEEKTPSVVLDNIMQTSCTEQQLNSHIETVLSKIPSTIFSKNQIHRWAMGEIMQICRGRFEALYISKKIQEYVLQVRGYDV